jgi:hypothetical protein
MTVPLTVIAPPGVSVSCGAKKYCEAAFPVIVRVPTVRSGGGRRFWIWGRTEVMPPTTMAVPDGASDIVSPSITVTDPGRRVPPPGRMMPSPVAVGNAAVTIEFPIWILMADIGPEAGRAMVEPPTTMAVADGASETGVPSIVIGGAPGFTV